MATGIFLTYLMCQTFYHSKKQEWSLTEFFMDYKKTYEELNENYPLDQMLRSSKFSGKIWQ